MYIYILFSLLILVLLLTKKKINYLLSWIIITIFSAIRFDVGNDYYYYYAISTQAGKNEYAQNFWFNINYDLKYNFFKFCSDIAFYFESPQFPIIVFSISTSYFTYKAINRFSINKNLSLFFYLCFPLFYFTSLSTIKQHLAVAIVLYSFKYIENRNIFGYLLLLSLGFFIHPSIIFLIPLYFMYKLRLNEKVLWSIYISSFFVSLALREVLLFLNVYSSYFESDGTYGIGGSKIIYIVNLLCFLVLISHKKLKNSNNTRFFVLSIVIGTFLYNALSPFGHLGMRSSTYFLSFLILLIPDLISSLNAMFRNKFSFTLIFYIFLFTIFNFTVYTNYKSVKGSSVVPYQTYFNKSFYDLKSQ